MKVRILPANEKDDITGAVLYGDIIKLEPMEDEPKEETDVSLEEKLSKYGIGNKIAQIAREHFQKHPEEIGLASLDSVLETFDERVGCYAKNCLSISDILSRILQSIERMRK